MLRRLENNEIKDGGGDVLVKKNKKDNLSCYEPFPREPTGSFEKFLFYRNLPDEFKKIHKSIQVLCTKWCWVDRCRLYDADRQLELAKKKDGKFDELSDVLLGNVEGLIKYANNLLKEVIENPVKVDGDEYSLASRIRMSKDVTSLLNSSHELLCNLCGRPSSYKNVEFKGEAEVKTGITVNLLNNIKKKREDLYGTE